MVWFEKKNRVCKECESGEVEDIDHFVMRCAYVAEEKERIEMWMSERVERWHEMEDNKKVVIMMDSACRDEVVAMKGDEKTLEEAIYNM